MTDPETILYLARSDTIARQALACERLENERLRELVMQLGDRLLRCSETFSRLAERRTRK